MTANTKNQPIGRPLDRNHTDDSFRETGEPEQSDVGRRASDHLLHGILDNVADGVIEVVPHYWTVWQRS